MMKRTNTLDRIVFASLICVISLAVACSERTPEVKTDDSASEELLPDQILYESDILLSDRGIRKVLIHSNYLEKYLALDSTLMVGIHATFYDSLGKESSTLVSDSGIVREKTSNLKVWGNVKVVSDNGVTLDADSLFWDQDANKIRTESYVKITHGDNVQTGYGLESDSRLTNFRIERQVKAKFKEVEDI
jgi:LPS export ABC transporter protein LptC